eukprot:233882_1
MLIICGYHIDPNILSNITCLHSIRIRSNIPNNTNIRNISNIFTNIFTNSSNIFTNIRNTSNIFTNIFTTPPTYSPTSPVYSPVSPVLPFYSKYLFQVIIVDINDIIIGESEWKLLTIDERNEIGSYYGDKNKVCEYFEKKIDKNNKGYIDVNQWINALKLNNICSDEMVAKRLFYYICYCGGQSKENMDEKLYTIQKKDFENFICRQDLYETKYGHY